MAKRPPLSEVVREALKRERKAKGMTQEQLCQRAKVSIDAVTRIESGSRTPNLATLEALAAALGLNPAELLSVEPVERGKSGPVARIEALLTDQPRVVQEAAEGVVKSLLKAITALDGDRSRPRAPKRN